MRSNAIPMPVHATAKSTSPPQALNVLQAHQVAENALAMALHYLRASASNIPGATRKAVQALVALNALQGLEPASTGDQRQTNGRA